MGFLNKLFRKKETLEPISLSAVKVDMHSHLIPGVDDGAKNMEDSLAIISEMRALGISHIITTPHIMSDLYPNTKEDLESRVLDLQQALILHKIDVTVQVSAEYYLDEHFLDLIRKKELMPFGDNYVLFEMGFVEKSPLLQKAIFELQSADYKPILAHPERYTYLHHSPEIYSELRDQGVHLQVNINSFTEHYSPQVKKIAEFLVDNELISFLGTDCHHLGHIELMKKALKSAKLHHLVAKKNLLNMELLK